MEELKGLPKFFTQHPFVKKIVQEEQAGVNGVRKAAIDEIARQEAEYLVERERLDKEILKAQEAVNEDQGRLDASRQHYGWLLTEKHRLYAELEHNKFRLQPIFRNSYREGLMNFSLA